MATAANKGARCGRWQRVPGRRGGRRLLRCKRYKRKGKPTGLRPANYGATCVKKKQVFSPWYNKKVWRCAKYGPGSPSSAAANGRNGAAAAVAAARNAGRPMPMPMRRLQPRPDYTGPLPEDFHIPMSLPSMERLSAGRTPVQLKLKGMRRSPGARTPKQRTFNF